VADSATAVEIRTDADMVDTDQVDRIVDVSDEISKIGERGN